MERPAPIIRSGSEYKFPGTVRFVCISDTHNRTANFQVPRGDVLLHCGDFTNIGSPDEVRHFDAFLESLPFTAKIVIAGNHDITFDLETFEVNRSGFQLGMVNNPAEVKAMLRHCTYLEDSGTEVAGYRIWGSPYLPNFKGWAFGRDAGEEIGEKWARIPDNTDILMTHNPPYSVLDTVVPSRWLWGCPQLLRRVKEVKPIVHVFGHVHEFHGCITLGYTTFINAATMHEKVNPPIVFDLPIRNSR